jgi:hypothetical protein
MPNIVKLGDVLHDHVGKSGSAKCHESDSEQWLMHARI